MTEAPGDRPSVRQGRKLVLVGAGHAHAQVLLSFIERPIPDLEITVVSPFTQAPYSGTVPAWLAGEYEWDECCIDFESLCRRAGARLLVESVAGIDPVARRLRLDSGGEVDYHWLSLNIGSTVRMPALDGAAQPNPVQTSPGSQPAARAPTRLVPMRPLTEMRARWDEVLDDVGRLAPGAEYRVVMVGGGAAGIESILAAHHRLTTHAPQLRYRFILATQGKALVPGLSAIAGHLLKKHLRRRGIVVQTGFSGSRIDQGAVQDDAGQSIPADVVLWATGAQAFEWPRDSGLATDARGFIRIDARLRSISHLEVFATGDCASWEVPLPKAGVYAVRMGPVLADNLRAAIEDTSLTAYVPQRRYLVLVGTGDPHAVASWGFLGWEGAWIHAWKKRIDRRFLARYNGIAS